MGTGASDYELAVFLLPQEVAKWGLGVCMLVLLKDPAAFVMTRRTCQSLREGPGQTLERAVASCRALSRTA